MEFDHYFEILLQNGNEIIWFQFNQASRPRRCCPAGLLVSHVRLKILV